MVRTDPASPATAAADDPVPQAPSTPTAPPLQYPHLAHPAPSGAPAAAAGSLTLGPTGAAAGRGGLPRQSLFAGAGAGAAAGRGAGGLRTADGYSVDQCVADMLRLERKDRRETGPRRTAAQLRPIAEGIISGVNKYFSGPGYGGGAAMAKTLISSAWKESKFNPRLGNGGVFQCAANRVAEYNKAHHTNISQATLSHMDPRRSIDISLWAMAHPSTSIVGRRTGGTAIPTARGQAALYYWNYNGREIGDYMNKTRYFQSLIK